MYEGQLGGARIGAGRKRNPVTIDKEENKKKVDVYRTELLSEIQAHAKQLAAVLVKKGLQGDIAALKEINDRCMGKAPQTLTGEDGGDLKITLTIFGDNDILKTKDA